MSYRMSKEYNNQNAAYVWYQKEAILEHMTELLKVSNTDVHVLQFMLSHCERFRTHKAVTVDQMKLILSVLTVINSSKFWDNRLILAR